MLDTLRAEEDDSVGNSVVRAITLTTVDLLARELMGQCVWCTLKAEREQRARAA